MEIQISTRGTELTDDMKGRVRKLTENLEELTSGLTRAKFVLEEGETSRAAGVVLSWGAKRDTVVRHAEAGDWDRVFQDLGRRIEKALEALQDSDGD